MRAEDRLQTERAAVGIPVGVALNSVPFKVDRVAEIQGR